MYGKIFDSLFGSSIMEEAMHTRLLWLSMIVLADEDGVLDMTAPALARRTNIPIDLVEDGLARLAAPDPTSRTDAEDGRRIVPLDGQPFGWQLVNYAHYRALHSNAERRDYWREYRRQRRAEGKDGSAVHCERSEQECTEVNVHNPSASASPSVEEKNTTTRTRARAAGFDEFWAAYPKKASKAYAKKCWEKAKDRPPLAEILAAIERLKGSRQWTKDGGDFIQNPATWINRGGWDDQPTPAAGGAVEKREPFRFQPGMYDLAGRQLGEDGVWRDPETSEPS
jgi:hypothetical protein